MKANATATTGNSTLTVLGAGPSVFLVGLTNTATTSIVRIGQSSDGNTFEVLDGRSFTMEMGQVRIGAGKGLAGNSNNTLLVDGTGSTFTVTNQTNPSADGDVLIGLSAANMVNNQLIVRNNGTFTTAGTLRVNGTTGTNKSTGGRKRRNGQFEQCRQCGRRHRPRDR